MNPTQLYYSSQWQVVEERIDTGTLALHTQYVWSPVYVDAMVMRDSDFTGDASFTANAGDIIRSARRETRTHLVVR